MVVKIFMMFALLIVSANIVFAKEKDLEIDVDYVNGSCSEYFAMLQFEFTNNTNKWVNVSGQSIDFGSEKINDSVTILTGKKLSLWSEANDLKNKRSKIKMNLLLGTLGAFSAAATKSNNGKLRDLGKFGALATAGLLTVQSVSSIKNEYKGSIFPYGHILREDILVPPSFTLIRWILVNTENNKDDHYISKLTLRYSVNDKPVSETFKIRNLDKMSVSHCSWQASLLDEDDEGEEY